MLLLLGRRQLVPPLLQLWRLGSKLISDSNGSHLSTEVNGLVREHHSLRAMHEYIYFTGPTDPEERWSMAHPILEGFWPINRSRSSTS